MVVISITYSITIILCLNSTPFDSCLLEVNSMGRCCLPIYVGTHPIDKNDATVDV